MFYPKVTDLELTLPKRQRLDFSPLKEYNLSNLMQSFLTDESLSDNFLILLLLA